MKHPEEKGRFSKKICEQKVARPEEAQEWKENLFSGSQKTYESVVMEASANPKGCLIQYRAKVLKRIAT